MQRETIIYNAEFCKSGCISVAQIGRDLMADAARRDDVEILAFIPQDDNYYKIPAGVDPWNLGPDKGHVKYIGVKHDSLTEKPFGYINNTWSSPEVLKRNDYYLCVTQRICACSLLQKVLSKPFCGFTCEVLNYISLQEFGDKGMFGAYPDTKYECMLFMTLHWNIFQNKEYLQRTTASLMEVFKPSVVQGFLDKSVVINLGVDGPAIDSVTPAQRLSDDAFIFVWGGRTSTVKGFETTLELANVMYCSGKNVLLDAHLISEGREDPSGKMKLWKEKYPFLHISVNTPQKDFWAAIKAADVYVTASQFESYGLSYVEAMRCGIPTIFFDRPWVHGVTPRGYPYIVRSKADALSILNTLYADKTVAKDLMADVVRFIDSDHSRVAHRRKTIDSWVLLSKKLRSRQKVRSWDDVYKVSD